MAALRAPRSNPLQRRAPTQEEVRAVSRDSLFGGSTGRVFAQHVDKEFENGPPEAVQGSRDGMDPIVKLVRRLYSRQMSSSSDIPTEL